MSPYTIDFFKWRIRRVFEENTLIVKGMRLNAGYGSPERLIENQEKAYKLLSQIISKYGFISKRDFGLLTYTRAYTLVYNLDAYPKFQKEFCNLMASRPEDIVLSDLVLLRRKLENAHE